MNEKIMVIRTEDLFENDYFESYISFDKMNFVERILRNYSFARREDVEHNTDFKQPVAYVCIINPETSEIFVSQRTSKKEYYNEERLYGTWGIGVGGHIRIHDDLYGNPVYNSIFRELYEEIDFNGSFNERLNLELIGYINSENGVSKYHFGLLYVFLTQSKKVNPKSREIEHGGLRKISEIEDFFNSDINVEDWTNVSLENVLKYCSDKFFSKESRKEKPSWFLKALGSKKKNY